jgi:enediyne biosynthesis protein E4
MPASGDQVRWEIVGSRRFIIALALAATLLLLGGWKWWQTRTYRRSMARIEEEIEQGLPAHAARELAALLAGNPDSDEANYWLGACEKMQGRPKAAAAAWGKVSQGSPFWPRAVEGRMEIEIASGRLAGAEQLINDINEGPRADESDASILLGPIYCHEGRLEEARRLIEARWDNLNVAGKGASEKAINLVRLYTEIESKEPPDDVARAVLDQAAASMPDDDRIWLGKAKLAIRTGSFDEATRLLKACLRRRPDDAAVWRAWLDKGLAANDVDAVRQALSHLPASESPPAGPDRLAAWLASRRGDSEREQRALERVVETDPCDFTALDRLTKLLTAKNQPERAQAMRDRRSEIERLKARYQELHDRHQPKRDASEMARLAGLLGRRFEARAYLTVAVAVDPSRADRRLELARLEERGQIKKHTGATLADILAPELGEYQPPRTRLTPTPADP